MNTSLLSQLFEFIKKQMDSLYYQSRESVLGHHKRDIVVIQVDQACNSLKSTRDQFEDALQQFKNIVNVGETSLAHRYKLLQRQFEFCKGRSDDVSYRIVAIEEVSISLFKEWEEELSQYNNRALRSRSRQQLKASKQQYNRLIKTMRKAESRIQPVLAAFKDQVLFLKHNLNAQAIAALQHEFVEIGIDISQLIEVMEITINEASQFVSTLVDQKALPSS
jgi:DNA-binding ferritin-like protein